MSDYISITAEPMGTVTVAARTARAVPGRTAILDLDALRFDVAGEVGRGGMGRIVAATDRRLGRQVAIKVCLDDHADHHDRLVREAAVLSLLEHPAIPPVYEVGRQLTGAPYFATRLIAGETLDARMRRAPESWRALLPCLADVADVMTYVHGRGVVHRDLKPGNILIESDDRVAVIDWGIARVVRPAGDPRAAPPSPHDVELTAHGAAIGTPGYWAPEQRRGELGDERSDVFALGAIAYRMVVGHPATPAVPVGTELDAAMASAPRWLVRLVASATVEAPERRLPSTAAFASALRDGLARGERTGDRGGGLRRVVRAAIAAAAVVVVCGGISPGSVADAASPTVAQVLTAPGYWQGDFDEMIFSVDGDRVRGVYAHDAGQFEGRIVGERVVGRWCEAPYLPAEDSGAVAFEVPTSAGGGPIHGHFAYTGDRDWAGRWDLQHVGGAPPPALVARLERLAITKEDPCSTR